jgi:hypothetical protein
LCRKNFLDCKLWTGFPGISASRWWPYCLIALGSASSFASPHAPFVGFATLAGLTLSRRWAMGTMGLIWLVNQVYGFMVRHYPLDAIALLWGMTMGLGTVIVTLIASIMAAMPPKFSRRSWVGQCVWVGITLLLGFTAYQSGILLVNQWVGMHGFTAVVFLRILERDLAWAIALHGLYTIGFNQQRLRQGQREAGSNVRDFI